MAWPPDAELDNLFCSNQKVSCHRAKLFSCIPTHVCGVSCFCHQGASVAATAELAQRVTASIATADMAATPPGAAACRLVSSGVNGQMALLSTKSAGRPHSQNRSARLTAVLTALAPLTRNDDSTAACMPERTLSLVCQQATTSPSFIAWALMAHARAVGSFSRVS